MDDSAAAQADVGVETAIRRGDADAVLVELIDRHGEHVYRYCRRMLGSDADADDLAQDVFLKVYEAVARGTEVANPRAYLLGIARHRCLDSLSSRRLQPVPVEHGIIERAAEQEPGIQLELLDPRAARALDDCLDALDYRSRRAVMLRFHDQLSYDEICQVTGDQPGALRVRVNRALPALRDCLRRKGVTP